MLEGLGRYYAVMLGLGSWDVMGSWDGVSWDHEMPAHQLSLGPEVVPSLGHIEDQHLVNSIYKGFSGATPTLSRWGSGLVDTKSRWSHRLDSLCRRERPPAPGCLDVAGPGGVVLRPRHHPAHQAGLEGGGQEGLRHHLSPGYQRRPECQWLGVL
jgi:hypothetical protein